MLCKVILTQDIGVSTVPADVPPGRTITLEWGPTALAFLHAAASGKMADGRMVEETAIIGPRSEGKSWASLGAVLLHSQLHETAGYPLPVPWLWFRDSFPMHEANLLKDIARLEWQGLWQASDGGRIVRAVMNGACAVEARLFGLEDISAIERMRGQAVGIYGEEPGPVIGSAVSTGWTEQAWETALSSIGDKVPSHHFPAIIASNPSQRSHWFWRRFVLAPAPTVGTFRIPSGERTTDKYRAKLARSFRSDPNLYARLVQGEASVASMGQAVVTGYRSSTHYRVKGVPLSPGPLYLGWDAYHHPACVIATLSTMGQLRIHYAKRMDKADIGILVEEGVKPWLAAKGLTGTMSTRSLLHIGDPTMDTGDQSDRSKTAAKALTARLPGRWCPSTNDILLLQGAVNEALRRTLSTGEPVILLGPDADELDEAWAGGWFLNEHGKPVQHGEAGQHSHVGMAGAYLVHAVFGGAARERDLGRWANQTAYTQPWDGAGPGERSPSPASVVMTRAQPGSAAYRERWTKQYREE